MTTPPAPDDPGADVPFDPYRFGKPDHPVPPEYAPPGYVPPAPAAGAAPPGAPSPYSVAGNAPRGQADPYGTPYPTPGPGAYGAPPPYYSYAQPRSGNGKAIASMVLGIVSILMFWLSIFDAVFVITGLVFGILALTEAGPRSAAKKGMAIAGLVCVTLGTVAALFWTLHFVDAVDKCGGFQHNNTGAAFKQCLRENI